MKKRILCSVFLVSLFFSFSSCGPGEKEINAGDLELSIRNILEMPAYEQIYRDIVYIGEKQKVLFFTTTDKKLLFSVDIVIQAGIKNAEDIKIKITDRNNDGTMNAVVYMPRSEVLLVDADEQTIEQYFIREWGGDISRLDFYNEINRRKDELVKTAISSGLLDKADSNAEGLIRGFLELSRINIVEFRREAGET